MLKPAIIFVVLVFALLAYGSFTMRASWIKNKIAALSAPASSEYAASNANIPPKGVKPRIVLIGDSRIAQWPTATLGDKWEVINRGIAGETVQQLAKRFDADALDLDPDVIVIEAGINDLVAASFMDDAEKLQVQKRTNSALQSLAGQGTAAGHHVIVATIIPPARSELWRFALYDASLRRLVIDFNSELRAIHWPERASLLDLILFLPPVDNAELPDEYRRDFLHLNMAGYSHLNSALAERLNSVIRAVRFKNSFDKGPVN